MDAVVAVLAVVVGCVMVYFSAISLYAYLQTGERVFRSRARAVSVDAHAALWHMGQLVFGALGVAAYGARVLRRTLASVQPPDRRDRLM
ncbi:hypothetical protein [Xanthomonas vasicola]|uniref:hypothetical protein n=1 Tax=Xanthomonas vasicola TaxID=56459 RepID=UPI000531A922|nr:hypothetical protein [Xanthomonas vasicola]AZR33268.1 hypothetical protein NX08_000745 [Xanthomonas vasicola]KGR55117.1 membrane protein [Xanthomonas vasicola]KGR56635.1 membrane protein [Xanthomonas vasicola]KGT85223.1 membrane protein [Xanthomonas vasicola]